MANKPEVLLLILHVQNLIDPFVGNTIGLCQISNTHSCCMMGTDSSISEEFRWGLFGQRFQGHGVTDIQHAQDLLDCFLKGEECCAPTGIRTPVLALKGPRPRPLDDGGV